MQVASCCCASGVSDLDSKLLTDLYLLTDFDIEGFFATCLWAFAGILVYVAGQVSVTDAHCLIADVIPSGLLDTPT